MPGRLNKRRNIRNIRPQLNLDDLFFVEPARYFYSCRCCTPWSRKIKDSRNFLQDIKELGDFIHSDEILEDYYKEDSHMASLDHLSLLYPSIPYETITVVVTATCFNIYEAIKILDNLLDDMHHKNDSTLPSTDDEELGEYLFASNEEDDLGGSCSFENESSGSSQEDNFDFEMIGVPVDYSDWIVVSKEENEGSITFGSFNVSPISYRSALMKPSKTMSNIRVMDNKKSNSITKKDDKKLITEEEHEEAWGVRQCIGVKRIKKLKLRRRKKIC